MTKHRLTHESVGLMICISFKLTRASAYVLCNVQPDRRSLIRKMCAELRDDGETLDLVRVLTILVDPLFGNIGINIGAPII